MKKFILFALASLMMCLTSCRNTTSDVMVLDFMCAFSNYDCRESQINCDYITKIHESKGEYRPELKSLRDSLTIAFEKIATEYFDSLYIKYGNEAVKKMTYLNDGFTFDSKEKMHKFYVNRSVSKILSNVTLEIKAQSIINPSEEDKIELINSIASKYN